MRAAQFGSFGGPEVLNVVDVPEPHPGPGEIRIAVRAAGINPVDWKFRQGMMGGELPSGTGYDAAGVVDELGEGVTGVAVGDRVFGQGQDVAAQLAVLSQWAPVPAGLDFTTAAGLPMAVETATRGLDLLAVRDGDTVLVDGASGGGQLPALVELSGGPDRVLTIADFEGAQQAGVQVTGGPGTEMAYDAIREIVPVIEAGHFALPVSRTFTLEEIADAHRVSEAGHTRGKLVLVVD